MDVISSRTQTARKTHGCQDCGRTIAVGESYRRQAIKDYGDIWTWTSCPHCAVVATWIFANMWREVGEDGLTVRPFVEDLQHDHPVLGELAPLIAAGYRLNGTLLTAEELTELLTRSRELVSF